MATLRFKAKKPAFAYVRYSMVDPQSDALYLGQSVLGEWIGASVDIEGEFKVRLPLIRR